MQERKNIETSYIKSKLQPSRDSEIQNELQNSDQNKYFSIYEFWPGKNRFLCCGFCMTGPGDDICQSAYTWCCILGVCIPYIIFVCPILYSRYGLFLPVLNAILFVSTILFLLLAGFTDPGIIPRKEVFEIYGEIPEMFQNVLESNEQDKNETKNTKINYPNSNNKIFCQTCRIWRPPRSSHCSDCDNCVEVMDHHCPFVNNCVAKRNYRYFMGFVTSVCILGISIVIGFLVWGIGSAVGDRGDTSSTTSNYLFWVLLFGIPLGIVVLVLLGFCFWNIFLIINGKTTREQLKKKEVVDRLNYDFNWCTLDPVLFDPRDKISHDQAKLICRIN